MSANVETMFSVRETPWHGLGNVIMDAPTSKEAIKQAGLDWRVVSSPMMLEDGTVVPNFKANVRESDNTVLGVVSGRYKILQNEEGFDFMDSLSLNGEVTYETAGSLAMGKRVWMLAKTDNFKILGDDFEGYICLSNSHDGKGAIRVNVTPIRVVCQNTLNLALQNSVRSWSTRHMGNIDTKRKEATNALNLHNAYMEELNKEAERLVKQKVSARDFNNIIDFVFPFPEDMESVSNRQKTNIEVMREDFSARYNFAPDLSDFRGTGWGVVNAITDYVSHSEPLRKTDSFNEKRFLSVVEGHKLVDKVTNYLKDVAV